MKIETFEMKQNNLQKKKKHLFLGLTDLVNYVLLSQYDLVNFTKIFFFVHTKTTK